MDLIDDPQPGENAHEYSVSEISGAVKRVVEGEFGRVRVRGEVGRVFPARSGHLYFDIKDDRSVIAAVSWKGQVAQLTAKPEEGMEVVVTGKLTTFPSQSKYQINVEDLRPAGVGALMAMLEKRKKQMQAEGLFAPERKREIPYLPEVIGIVTSPSGAVIRDILHRLRDRFPRRVIVWPVAVQGAACAPEVTRAIEGFNALPEGGAVPRPDLIIVARGGGSMEDLWGFNEESVARAVAASDIPLISAVGHETDTTLIDNVSDMRAPTPTAAAEAAVPVRRDLAARLVEQEARLKQAQYQILTRRTQRLADLARALPRPATITASARQRFDAWEGRLASGLRSVSAKKRQRLTEVSGVLRPGLLAGRLRDGQHRVGQLSSRLSPALGRMIELKRTRLSQRVARLSPAPIRTRIGRQQERIAGLQGRLDGRISTRLAEIRARLGSLDRLRETLGYRATLQRGYAVVRGDGEVMTSAKAARKAREIEIEFADDRVKIGGGKPAPKAKPPKDDPDQGSLL